MRRDVTVPALRARAIEGFKIYLFTALYLWVVLGSFTIYRRLVLAESGNAYLHYGIAVVESLVIAKVIFIGRLFGFSRRFEDRPLVVPVFYKAGLFGVLVLLFAVAEHALEGWFRGQGWLGGLHNIQEVAYYEIGARVLTMIVAFIPFFAFTEIGRIVGRDRLSAMFFSKPAPGGRDPA